ncbi:Predicted arabinose efflux permease, MFS family [Actinopolyspora lacussalsi subsp. righensis]|uniref:Predicted arabinose efflux permease, MFS family n=1 Tax=Actinopolyspora righensis TaxID=995060 RepID=A0A1I7AJZ4_9ACTN|nr:Predicted arabinose efflux permease, MFS family [Actinopolyspora righensis]
MTDNVTTQQPQKSESETEQLRPPASSGRDAPPGVAPRWWVWLTAFPVAAIFALSNAATPLYVLWQRDIGFSQGVLTVIFALYIVGLIGSLLVCGVVSDRLGRKTVLFPALILALIACLMFAAADSVLVLCAARLFTGISVGAAVSAGMAAVTDVGGASRKRLAALLASTAMVLGAGLGPMLAGVLSELAPGPTVTVFAVEAGLLALALLVVWRMPVSRPRSTGSGAWIRVPSVPKNDRLRLVLGIAVFAPGITATSFVLSLGPSLLASLLGSTNRMVAGGLAFVMFLIATGIQFAVQRMSVPRILQLGAVSTVLSMVAMAAAVFTNSVPPLALAALLAGCGQGMGQLGGLSLLNASVPGHRLAEANAGLNVGGYALAGTLPVLTGYLSDLVGLAAGTMAFGIVLIVLAATGGVIVTATRKNIEPTPSR